MTGRRYVVRRTAWNSWEQLGDVPYLLTDVVEALEALPAGRLEVRRLPRPPAVVHLVSGVVFQRRFQVKGIRDADGRWLEVWSVKIL